MINGNEDCICCVTMSCVAQKAFRKLPVSKVHVGVRPFAQLLHFRIKFVVVSKRLVLTHTVVAVN